MKNTLYAAVILLLAMVGYIYLTTDKKDMRPDSMENAAFLISKGIQYDNYDSLKRYFFESAKENVTKVEFEEMQKVMTSGYEYKHYTAIKLTNGEVLLMSIEKDLEDGLYKASDVIKVPKEMHSLFE